MLAIQSGIAQYHCLYIQGAVPFQTPGVFLTHPVAWYYGDYCMTLLNLGRRIGRLGIEQPIFLHWQSCVLPLSHLVIPVLMLLESPEESKIEPASLH